MAKKETITTAAEQQQDSVLASSVGETPTILTATTREELFQQVEQLKTTLQEGQTLTAGAVGRSRDDGQYTIQVNII